MPRGGRRRTTWNKHNRPKGGRKKGSKDKIPRGFKGTMREMAKRLVDERPAVIWDALMRGIKAPAPRSFPYVEMVAKLTDDRATYTQEEMQAIVGRLLTVFMAIEPTAVQQQRFVSQLRGLGPKLPVTIDVDAAPSEPTQAVD